MKKGKEIVVKNQVILNLIQDLRCLLWLLVNNVRGRCQIKFGMTSLCNNSGYRGFTLIELLVVVLIIGILAAVAVPQYQKAVEKSRATQAFVLLKSLSQAAQSYYLANGTYPTKFNELDIDLTWTDNKPWHNMMEDTLSNNDWAAQLHRTDTYFAVWVGRISGEYTGAGFGADSLHDFKIRCIEDAHQNNAHPFSKPEGSYCEKIFNGTLAADSADGDSSMRRYELH